MNYGFTGGMTRIESVKMWIGSYFKVLRSKLIRVKHQVTTSSHRWNGMFYRLRFLNPGIKYLHETMRKYVNCQQQENLMSFKILSQQKVLIF